MNTQGRLHLLVGPVGAGKSTFARGLMARSDAETGSAFGAQRNAVFLDLDAWMVRLYGEDARPRENVLAWYLERRERVRELLWDTSLDILAAATDVVLELGLVSRAEREAVYAKARDEGLELTVYWVDAPRDVRRERVAQRNGSGGKHVQVVPMEFFERASDAWEAPSEEERRGVSFVDV